MSATEKTAIEAELSDSAALAKAIQTLFQPLARMLVRQGIGAKSTLDCIKRAYVAATMDVLKERDLPITTPRLSLFTGLTAREVEQISRDLTDSAGEGINWHDVAAVVLMAWHVDPRFTMAFTGTPAELEIEGTSERPSFNHLVQLCAPTADPKHLLEQLVRAGSVQINPDTQRVQAISRAYIHEPLSPSYSQRLGKMVRNYTETLYANVQMLSREERRFDRNVVADFPVNRETEQAFRHLVHTEAQAMLELLDKWLQEQQPDPDGVRVGLGVFQYAELETPEAVTMRPRNDRPAKPSGAGSTPSGAGSPSDIPMTDEDVIDVLNYQGPKK